MKSKEDPVNIKIKYESKDFTCFDTQPAPPPAPPVPTYPKTGEKWSACTGIDDTCGDNKDLCCGVAMNGLIVDKDGKTTGKNILSAAICNVAPGDDGKSKAEDWTNRLLSADKTINWTFVYTGADFKCFKDAPKPPGPPGPGPGPDPNQPKPPSNSDANVGGNCKVTADCQALITDEDKKADYCCGVASGGVLIDDKGAPVGTEITTTNMLLCNKVTAIPMEAGYKDPNGNQVTIQFQPAGFTCLKQAKALIASAAVMMGIASMI